MALISCIKDFIGVEGCTSTVPNSGIYINQLPGIELRMIDKLADEQQVDFNGVWDDVQERAVRRFKNDINSEFRKRYRIKSITQSINIGRDVTTTTTAVGVEYRGFTLEIGRTNTEHANSNLQAIQLQSVDLFFNSLDGTTIKVYDMDLGTELYTLAVAAPVATGWTRINIFQTFDVRRIFVCYDATLLEGSEQDVLSLKNKVNTYQEAHYHVACYCNGLPTNAELRAGSATIAATIVEDDITFADDTFGLSGIWSVVCSYESFVCNNLETFTTSFLYLLGVELMNERLYSPRLNEFTTFDRDKAGELKNMYEVYYRGGTINEMEHEGALTLAIDGINISDGDYCIECNEPVTFRDAII